LSKKIIAGPIRFISQSDGLLDTALQL